MDISIFIGWIRICGKTFLLDIQNIGNIKLGQNIVFKMDYLFWIFLSNGLRMDKEEYIIIGKNNVLWTFPVICYVC